MHGKDIKEEEIPEPQVKENLFMRKINTAPKREVVIEEPRQSDVIIQNLLNASKLLEGRFTFEEILKLDIPAFEKIVNNEFANIDKSYKDFRENGTINAYTKHEPASLDESVLKQFERNVKR